MTSRPSGGRHIRGRASNTTLSLRAEEVSHPLDPTYLSCITLLYRNRGEDRSYEIAHVTEAHEQGNGPFRSGLSGQESRYHASDFLTGQALLRHFVERIESPLDRAVPAAIRLLRCSRSVSVRMTGYVFFIIDEHSHCDSEQLDQTSHDTSSVTSQTRLLWHGALCHLL